MIEKLLPCPFCGCEEIEQDWSNVSNFGDNTIKSTWIECPDCGAGFTGGIINGVEPEPTIVTKWNTRK